VLDGIEHYSWQAGVEKRYQQTLAVQGKVSPRMCSDFNAPPPYTRVDSDNVGEDIVAVSAAGNKLSVNMRPNEISVLPDGAKELVLYSAWSPLVSVENGSVIKNEVVEVGGAIPIVVQNNQAEVIVRYRSRTVVGAGIISLGALILIISGLVALIRKEKLSARRLKR